jgi:hypothetical protein
MPTDEVEHSNSAIDDTCIAARQESKRKHGESADEREEQELEGTILMK